jgi:hypothetical protein
VPGSSRISPTAGDEREEAARLLTGTQAIELDWLKGNKWREGIGQALHYGDVTGQQPVLALISAYYNIFGAEQQKLEYVSGLCAAHGVEVWALTTKRE